MHDPVRLKEMEKALDFPGRIYQAREHACTLIAALTHPLAPGKGCIGGIHRGVLGEGGWKDAQTAIAHVSAKALEMRTKNALHGLYKWANLDGAKYGILCERPLTPRQRLSAYHGMGEFLRILNDIEDRQILAAGDVGTTPEDLGHAWSVCPAYIRGISEDYGGVGNTGVYTAKGVLEAMQIAQMIRFGDRHLFSVAIKGVGKAGKALLLAIRIRHGDKVKVVIADINPAQYTQEIRYILGVNGGILDPESIHREGYHIFAPCAEMPEITPATVDEIRCRMIIGAANTQCESDELDDCIHERGIFRLPGVLVNGMGVRMVGWEEELRRGLSVAHLFGRELASFYVLVEDVVHEATRTGVAPYRIVRRIAAEELAVSA
ncbi:MAG: hypothetical protein AAB539_04645 [Patescibacteria group bacterium]